MEMRVQLAGGKRVIATLKGFEIATDQPTKSGGEGSAPAPFDLFLASIGTCAAYYVLDFCAARNIPTTGIQVLQSWDRDTTSGLITSIRQQIVLPPEFPAKYEQAVMRAASLCSVKKHLEHPPRFEIQVARQGSAARGT